MELGVSVPSSLKLRRVNMREKTSKEHFASKNLRLTPSEKLKAVREVLSKENKTLGEVSQKYQVSRQTLSSWIGKFDPKKGKISLNNHYRRGKNHPKKLSYKIEKTILDLV